MNFWGWGCGVFGGSDGWWWCGVVSWVVDWKLETGNWTIGSAV
jgi:hypothetical protein